MNEERKLYAPAKLNLYLDITGKRADGYHLLETVMTSVSLCDIVTIKKEPLSGEITVGCTDDDIPVNEGNICHKAAKLFFEVAGIKDGAKIFIEKNIPHGAGMGGGSADAAAVFKGLNELYGGPLSKDTLLKLGEKTGADVPFCIAGGTRICRGTGEIMGECISLPKRYYLIVMPDISCDTKAAYARYDKAPTEPENALEKFLRGFPKYMYNVFEGLYQSGEIPAIKQKLLENGAENALLTGSGAAVFGVFKSRENAEKAKRAFSGMLSYVVENYP